MSNSLPSVLFENQSNQVPIHSYSNIDNEYIENNFAYLTKLSYVEAPIVLLPDFHHKPLLETPSSSVVVTHKRFSLALTSPSQNCGMSFILTPFSQEDISSVFIERFMAGVKATLPLKNQSPVLSTEDVLHALRQGAQWAVKKFELSQDMIHSIEHGGRLVDKQESSASGTERTIPSEIIELSRKRFGILGGGNHFLELQVVDEILDDTIAKIWGLRQNQIVLMFHTGSDVLGAYLGRLYAFRKKTDIKHQIHFYRKKITYHLSQPPWKSIPQRLLYYFLPTPFRFINPDIPEGKRALSTIHSAANFGFASRIAIFNAIQNAFAQVAGDQNIKVRLLYDCSHNSIYREHINGNTVWAHRHNACRVLPPSLLKEHPVFALSGQPVILPGTNRTSSFICAGREGAIATHYTVDHGLGAVQKHYEKNNPAGQLKEYTSLFNYEKNDPEKIPLLADTAINEAVGILNEADIIGTVARLKPLATLKGPKSKVV